MPKKRHCTGKEGLTEAETSCQLQCQKEERTFFADGMRYPDEPELGILRAAASYLSGNPKVIFNPWPQYPNEVMDAMGTLPTDYNYLSHHTSLEDKPIASMDLDDIATMYTFIQRGERFCDGHIASFIEDGTLYRIVQRHIELLLRQRGCGQGNVISR